MEVEAESSSEDATEYAAEKVVAEGIADEESVDTAMKLGGNIPKGPFELKRL